MVSLFDELKQRPAVKMELSADSDRARDSTSRSSPLEIDLNEIPSSSDSFDVVRSYHDVPDLPHDPPAAPVLSPGPTTCAACGLPEDDGGRVVLCDACDRGFHTACVDMRRAGGIDEDDWVCGSCTENGVRSQLWPLGFKSKRKPVLDMNASPPSDGEDAGQSSRKRPSGDNSGHPFGSSVRRTNSCSARSGFGFNSAPGFLSHSFEAGFEKMRHCARTRYNASEVGFDSPVASKKSDDTSMLRFSQGYPSQGEMCLHALREYISQRHGVLDEGWHVDLKQSNGGMHAAFYAPNGEKFNSMHEVASHLGLDCKLSDLKTGSLGSTLLENFHLPRKRKPAQSMMTNGFTETKELLLHALYKEFLPISQRTDASSGNDVIMTNAPEAGNADCANVGSEQSPDGLPVQFEDLFILSLGKIDSRPSYHRLDQIWPIGYRSCWHDNITGSFFFCELLDGGEYGPVFKIRRCSCSTELVPNASTVFIRSPVQQSTFEEGEESSPCTYAMELDEVVHIHNILSDPLTPAMDAISTFPDRVSSMSDDVSVDIMQVEASCGLEKSGTSTRDGMGEKDEIGEIVVEERSSSAAWTKMSQKLMDSFSNMWSTKDSVQLVCKHAQHETFSLTQSTMDSKCDLSIGPLQKFQSSLISRNVMFSENGRRSFSEVMAWWWSLDRFGLDVEFVQEMTEQLPGLEVCSQYVLVNKRSNYLELLTLSNESLVMRGPDGAEVKKDEFLESLVGRSKQARVVDSRRPPPAGTSLCQRLLPDVAGCYQAWEVLWRFHEILGLKETFSLEELEKELAIPPINAVNFARKWEEHHQLSNFIKSDKVGGQSPSGGTSVLTYFEKNRHAPVPEGNSDGRESAEVKNTTIQRGTCFGVTLTNVHGSLLAMLIGELQSKVAPLVDPSFDGGESKPKRGRKKDVDSYVPVKRSNLHMLPINELSWPELARRYILAILCMGGSADSAEVINRDSGKIFRCLQGDGGLLCGALSGVAGMEADAILLAEASRKIFGFLGSENAILTIEGKESIEASASGISPASETCLPEWAQALEPVKKLPTNVGTRIRNCVYDALNKHPPEWARKRLEHSISKEVYKGNASGPTKKAVISVLADASNDKLPQTSENGKKGNSVITISDILMKQCRAVLRQAAAADDSKMFCNLLGRKLVNSSDNDDEGLLGFPAMVSRPLDFRTIDLRLAVGAYGGSQEAFLEDVHELWENLRFAFGDQPDFVELGDKLSEKFESLFAEKVIPLAHQLGEYRTLESLSSEKKKELSDLVSSLSLLPKAPWDEGVCKVCGVDRDDDSVLLCDTCDGEYHTYCLNPPLSRIPEGNWYCPSCVSGRRVTLDGSELNLLIHRRRGRRDQGELTCDYLETLSCLASMMEEKEYWDYSAEERIFLVKFLCDELLNSAVVRQHLEHCAETSLELQQKLRSLLSEYKALNLREEFLARTIKTNTVMVDRAAEALNGGLTPLHACNGSSMAERESQKNLLDVSSDQLKEDSFRDICFKRSKKNHLFNDPNNPSFQTNGDIEDAKNGEGNIKRQDNLSSNLTSGKNIKSSELNELPASVPDPEEPKDLQREGLPEERNTALAQRSHDLNEAQSLQDELNSLRSHISRMKSLISNIQLQILKVSIRREFLGSDSLGRLYWAAAFPGDQLRFVVDESMAAKIAGKATGMSNFRDSSDLEGSKACCPYWYDSVDAAAAAHSSLISYQNETEIDELIGWLRDNDTKEKALKDAILHWRKFRSQDSQDCRDHDLDTLPAAPPLDLAVSDHSVTKASQFLETKYGPCLDSLTRELLNEHEKRGYLIAEDKICRCICLEPVLPTRLHCLTCHKTFLTEEALQVHKEAKCASDSADHNKGTDILYLSREKDKVPMFDKNSYQGLGSKFIKHQNERSMCPYDIDEISSKLVTKDSNRELVAQIGLIGSNGVPSFVTSRSPYLDDSTVELVPKGGAGIWRVDLMDVDGALANLEKRYAPNMRMSDSSSARTVSEKSASKNSNRATSRCHKEKDGSTSRDVPTCRCVVPSSSLRPLVGEASNILRRLKMNLLDMEAALCEEAFRPSRAQMERRWAWRAFIKSAQTIYEMIQAAIVFEDMIKTCYLRNEWWHWSSLSAAIKTSTLSSLALRVYSLDSSIIYEKNGLNMDSADNGKRNGVLYQNPEVASDTMEKPKASRKSSRKRKEPEG